MLLCVLRLTLRGGVQLDSDIDVLDRVVVGQNASTRNQSFYSHA
jgi:hypothetical protein